MLAVPPAPALLPLLVPAVSNEVGGSRGELVAWPCQSLACSTSTLFLPTECSPDLKRIQGNDRISGRHRGTMRGVGGGGEIKSRVCDWLTCLCSAGPALESFSGIHQPCVFGEVEKRKSETS